MADASVETGRKNVAPGSDRQLGAGRKGLGSQFFFFFVKSAEVNIPDACVPECFWEVLYNNEYIYGQVRLHHVILTR